MFIDLLWIKMNFITTNERNCWVKLKNNCWYLKKEHACNWPYNNLNKILQTHTWTKCKSLPSAHSETKHGWPMKYIIITLLCLVLCMDIKPQVRCGVLLRIIIHVKRFWSIYLTLVIKCICFNRRKIYHHVPSNIYYSRLSKSCDYLYLDWKWIWPG